MLRVSDDRMAPPRSDPDPRRRVSWLSRLRICFFRGGLSAMVSGSVSASTDRFGAVLAGVAVWPC